MEFSNTTNYEFHGPLYLIEDPNTNTNTNNNIIRKKEDEKKEIYFLGNFICYISVPMAGEIYDQGKALFDNGIITSNYYSNVIKY